MKRPYYIYAADISDWTIEDEATYSHTAICDGKIYYISTVKEDKETVSVIPPSLEGWARNCELSILAKKTEKTVAKAKKRLQQDFKDNLDKALQEQTTETDT